MLGQTAPSSYTCAKVPFIWAGTGLKPEKMAALDEDWCLRVHRYASKWWFDWSRLRIVTSLHGLFSEKRPVDVLGRRLEKLAAALVSRTQIPLLAVGVQIVEGSRSPQPWAGQAGSCHYRC